MAIYHMQAKVVSRGSGRSAVAASAYMSCSRMYNDYDGIQHDYTRKQGLIYQEVMLPPMAPLEWNDRVVLCQEKVQVKHELFTSIICLMPHLFPFVLVLSNISFRSH